MSTFANRGWETPRGAAVAAMPIPVQWEETALREHMRNLRDTLLVLGLQIVFRATMMLRRWNY